MKKELFGLFIVALVAGIGCSYSHEVVAKGKSEATITVEKGFSITVKGPIDIPDAVPVIGGLTLGPGAELDVDIPKGTEIKLDDKVDISGDGSDDSKVAANEGSERRLDTARAKSGTAQLLSVRPYPMGTTSFSATVWPGSTYTWFLPDLFGEDPSAGAEVQVTGWLTAEVWDNALVTKSDGSFRIKRGGFKGFAYEVIGPPAVWQAPFDTPHGKITGDGTIETSTGMTFEFAGNPASVSGTGTTGYTDPNGITWKYGYVGTFPVKLTSSGGDGTGATTVDGGADVWP